MAKILICGDYAPTTSNQAMLSTGVVRDCVGDALASVFAEQSLIAVNIETSLTEQSTPKAKRGQINQSDPNTCLFLKNAGVGLCFLANNHVIDNGNPGVLRTMEVLREYGLPFMGAGCNASDASKPFRTEVDGRKICFLNIANYEFNRCTQTQYGVHVYDPLETFDYIRSQKQQDELLILVYHGGVEYYQYPSPQIQKVCRKFVDCGADIVLCQHSHCIGTFERYAGGYIMYGQGNFLFDDSEKELEKTAVLVELETTDGSIKLIPVKKTGSLVELAEGDCAAKILGGIMKRHEQIQEPGAVEERFRTFAKSQKREITNALMGYNRIYKILNKLTCGRAESAIYNKKARMRLYNITNSPALQEVLNEVLSDYE